MGALLFDVGGWDNLGGEMEPFAEIIEAFRSQGVIVPLPRKLGLEIATGCKRLASFDDLSPRLAYDQAQSILASHCGIALT